MTTGQSQTSGRSENHSESEGYQYGESESRSHGGIEAFDPVLEERPTAVFSLEEQIYRAMGLMVNQPERQFLLKIPSNNRNS